MPHLIIEYSENLLEKEKLAGTLKKLQTLIAESLPTKISSCKGRAIACSDYLVGDGAQAQGFMHVNLKILSGRGKAQLEKIAEQLLAILKSVFSQSIDELNIQLSLEINELPDLYFKG